MGDMGFGSFLIPTMSPSESEGSRTENKMKLYFSSVVIEGDSHARKLAAYVREHLSEPEKLLGVCKPSARLLDVLSGKAPPLHGCCVLIAGTNDIAQGNWSRIYQEIEEKVMERLKTCDVILCTIPFRHDLSPYHLIHYHTYMVNYYMWELAMRNEGVHILDVNDIERSWFDQLGIHLSRPGKRILAGKILKSLSEANQSAMQSKRLQKKKKSDNAEPPLNP